MTTAQNSVETRATGVRALIATLGYDGAQQFLRQSRNIGSGDFTNDRYMPTHDELVAAVKQLQDAAVTA